MSDTFISGVLVSTLVISWTMLVFIIGVKMGASATRPQPAEPSPQRIAEMDAEWNAKVQELGTTVKKLK